AAGRRLYIPRGASQQGATARLTIFNLDTLKHVGDIDGAGGHGTAVDPKAAHGFVSGKPVSMFDTKTMKMIKTIDPGPASPDGILFDAYNERVYIFSHPTKDATVIDAKDGSVLGTIDLGGTPEEGIADGHGKLYVVMQDMPGSVTVVDVNQKKATAHYPLGDIGRCNGLALDSRNGVLFAACAASGNPPAQPAQPKMVILSATDGKILTTLDMPGSSDGAVFNPETHEAFATLGNGKLFVVKENSPTRFAVEQALDTMNGARTIALDSKTGHIFTMADERQPPPPAGPAPSAAAPGASGMPAAAPSAAGQGAPGQGRAGRGRGFFRPAVPGSFTILMIGK
ncbi:MAG TPA: hypothetical protein VGL62_10335, partial [Vicinamibacterales bacterium]